MSARSRAKPGLRIERRINQDFAVHQHANPPLRQAERKPRRELKAVAAVNAAPLEDDFHRGLEFRASRHQREVDGRGEHAALDANHLDGERSHAFLGITHHQTRGRPAAGRDVIRELDVELKPGNPQPADEPGNDERRGHRREDQEQQVVGGSERGQTGQQQSEDVEETGQRHAPPDARRKPRADSGPHGPSAIVRPSFARAPRFSHPEAILPAEELLS